MGGRRLPGAGIVLGTGAAAAMVMACFGVAPAPRPASSEMQAHFASMEDVRAAAVSSDLVALRDAARRIAERGSVEGIPPDARRHLVELRTLARAIQNEAAPTEAIRRTAALAGECGACHRQVGADVASRMARGPRPDAGSGHAARMGWTVDRMWDGVVTPSDASWSAGGSALADGDAFGPTVRERLADAARADSAVARLQRLSGAASQADDSDARVDVLGDVLLTCSGCHGTSRGNRPPRGG